MTTEEVLRVCRRALTEVDLVASQLTDEELYAAMSDERDKLELKRVPDFDQYQIVYVQDESGYGITPEPTLEIGTILALKAAATILRQTYRDRVNRGEIGVSWSSGLESESSLAAGRDYLQMIKAVEDEAQQLVLIKIARFSGFRAQ